VPKYHAVEVYRELEVKFQSFIPGTIIIIIIIGGAVLSP
jgi:hypothetical protein